MLRMEFKIHKREKPSQSKYEKKYIDVAYEFSKKLYKEFGEFLKAVVLFGAAARKTYRTGGDIDILVVVDDVSIYLTPEIVEAYRIIVKKLIGETSLKLHVTTMRLTSFWEYVRAGDPIAINILRDGLALIDTGFFDPLQLLLKQGRIRPTWESIWTYFARAPQTLYNSKWHLLQGVIDLYWAVIDAAHAALMRLGEIPPTPSHVADMIEERMVKTKLIDKRYASIMRNFYKLSKMIIHREIKEVSGQEFDRYYKEAESFVRKMEEFIRQEHEKHRQHRKARSSPSHSNSTRPLR